MRIAVIGVGYVGLCSGVGFALKGHKVIGVTTTADKSALINSGKSPIFEAGLDEALKKCVSDRSFMATTDIESAVAASEVTFLCVGTPSGDDGSIDLAQVKKASAGIGNALKNMSAFHVVVVKSTVVPETTEEIVAPVIERCSEKKAGRDFGIAMNPEFLREGKAMDDFLKPDRIVCGASDKKSFEILRKVYADFAAPVLETSIRTAEMIKYASNAFLATKISFINELGNMCKKLGIDTYEVANGMGMDKRIGPHFLQAGIGYGGSCFPKDTRALIFKARESGMKLDIVETVEDVNRKQRHLIIDMLGKKLPLNGNTIAVLGLAFKAGTDDMRESPVIDIIKSLQKSGALVRAYDPQAIENARKILPDVDYYSDIAETLRNADACLVLTEWPEFSELTDDDFAAMKQKIIIEGRRILNPKKVSNYEGICW